MHAVRAPALIIVCLAFAACASEPAVLHLLPDEVQVASLPVWPGPPERARLEYVGELVGEENFRNRPQPASTTSRILRWIAGLGNGEDQRVRLVRPQSGMVDEHGRILVTDVGRQAVVVFDPAAGSLFLWGDAETGVPFSAPLGIAADGDGGFWVADPELGALYRLAADGTPVGRLDHEHLQRPTGLALDAANGLLYVADTAAHDIKVFAGDGRYLTTIGGPGTAAGEFNAPTHLSFADGHLYVTDTLNVRVQILDARGEAVSTIGQRGLHVGNLVRPKGVATDATGHVYVIESYYDHLLVFDRNGRFLLPVGGTGSGRGQFFLPAGIWSDDANRLYVADMFNGRVVVFDYVGDGLL